jgi:hypothetical protein
MLTFSPAPQQTATKQATSKASRPVDIYSIHDRAYNPNPDIHVYPKKDLKIGSSGITTLSNLGLSIPSNFF